MRGRLSSLFYGVALLLGSGVVTSAASPLTKAEERICRNLSHCLKIVDAHPMDSFDYAVLANEFKRFGPRGRDALIRRIQKGGIAAGHAADLLALAQNASALAPLRALDDHKDEEIRSLVTRTQEALQLRLTAKHSDTVSKTARTQVANANIDVGSPCPAATPIQPVSQSREMPFFEAEIAQPDAYGAYRPSATYRVPHRHTQRGNLTSAVSMTGGWLAGYPGGLIRYDDETGAPDVLSDASVISLQRHRPFDLGGGVWAIVEAPEGLLVADVLPLTVMARLPGQLNGLGRLDDDRLVLSTTAGVILSLSPDGTVTQGCEAPA
ncbi:MAG: hypothetical protein AAFP97_07970 [Pseudomonadota bacterium]